MAERALAEVFHPGEFIREELEERGWTQTHLAEIMGRPSATISQIITGKKSVTPETARELASTFGTSAELWLNLQSAFDLSKVGPPDESIRDRAKIFEIAPVKEMERRGWIAPCESIEELTSELEKFYDTKSLDEISQLRMAAKISAQNGSVLTPEQRAWCQRVLQLAKAVPAERYSEKAYASGIDELRGLAAHPEQVNKIPRVLAQMGIRFVVVEHLQKTKIDGAALWLGEGWDKPVIALSMRYDRIDSFWHTLFHECSHIKHKDQYALDVDLVGADRCLSNESLSEVENRANTEAAEMLIPRDKLQSFILRTRPFYSSERLIQFAHLIKIHPGIIAGQLQFKKEIDWSHHRKMLVKVKDLLISGALTDGWGTIISTRR